ncbi:MAG: hypothetical protein K2H01_05735 [Ruminococcus sp.]|nr:hypothetical protein [Ruminococcus sp.]
MKPCFMCTNARVDFEFTDKNDFSSIGVGVSDTGFRMSIDAGFGKPLRIDVSMWDEGLQQNKLVCRYFPKFCPNCGRKINEYEGSEKACKKS